MDKGTLFIDINGTVINTETEEALPFAIEKINKAFNEGYLIVITTFRRKNWPTTSQYHVVNSERLFKIIGLNYHHIIWDSPSPRIIINDDVVGSVSHPTNGSWEKYEF